MTRKCRGAQLLVVVGALLVLVSALLLPDVASAAVPAGVTKGLDYLHAHQRGDGGFSLGGSHGSASLTPWATLAIAAGGNDPALWRVEGHSPVTFLQGTDLTSVAAASGNAPEYYALCILAYRGADRTNLLKSAGTTKLDLVAKLESYQSSEGYYSPAIPATTSASTETTAWAILGLDAAQQSGPPMSGAVAWLQTNASGCGGPNADGGFGSQPASQSSTTVTSLVAQALVAGGVPANNAKVQGAAGFIESMETSEGGFQDASGGSANALSTAWAIEGLHASGTDPNTLGKGGHTPSTFLGSLCQTNGSYESSGDLVQATAQTCIALAGTALPVAPAGDVASSFDPVFVPGSVAPVAGKRFTTSALSIKAAYHDSQNGTGIATQQIRITLDGVSKTKAADITATHLTLKLTKLTNGSHTVVITIYDRAGNAARIERRFTVAVPVVSSDSSGDSSSSSDSSTSSDSSSSSGSNSSPTPVVTLTPVATTSPTAGASPSASVPGRTTRARHPRGKANTETLVGASLASIVPLGIAGSWLKRRRLLKVMDRATRGEILPRSPSLWGRFWKSGRSPWTDGGE